MIARVTVANRNILARFVELANILGWVVDLPRSHTLSRDKTFPLPNRVVESGDTEWYTINKDRGLWSIVRISVEMEKCEVVLSGLQTRTFESALESTIKILQESKKGSYSK